MPGKFDETLRNLKELSCTWYFNVPVGYDMLVDAMEADRELAERFYSDLGMLFYAGAGMAQKTWDRLISLGREVTGRDISACHGPRRDRDGALRARLHRASGEGRECRGPIAGADAEACSGRGQA